MKLALDVAEAAVQTASQYSSTMQALQKARKEEKKAYEKDQARRKKELEAQKSRELKAAAKAQKKAEAKAAAEAKNKKAGEGEGESTGDEDPGEMEVEGTQGDAEGDNQQRKKPAARRRGRGGSELTDDDLPVLVNRFPDQAIPVYDSVEGLLKAMTRGSPAIWRARRAPLKKIFQDEGLQAKDAQNMVIQLGSELHSFIALFAEKCNENPEQVKSTHGLTEQVQHCKQLLALEVQLCQLIEKEHAKAAAGTHDGSTANLACTVIDKDSFLQEFEVAANQVALAAPMADTEKMASQEREMWCQAQMVAHQRGKTWSGVLSGLYPHLVYQSEGTRAIALVPIQDVTCLDILLVRSESMDEDRFLTLELF